MNALELYFHLLRATATTFAGLGSLPVLQADLVEHHHVLTNEELNLSIVAGRSTPGPAGLYVVNVGYYVAGVWGAIAGWAAMITPSFLAVVLLRALGRRAHHPRAERVIGGVVLASAGLLWATIIPLGRQAVTDPLLWLILILGVGLLATRKIEGVWVILGSAALYLAAASLHIVSGL